MMAREAAIEMEEAMKEMKEMETPEFVMCPNCLWLWQVGQKYCGECGNKLPEPEPEVIIKKSGETFVARENGVDWFCHEPENLHDHINDGIGVVNPEHFFKAHHDCWKRMFDKDGNSIIELTDEIAKLRPIVVDRPYILEVLLGVYKDCFVTSHDRTSDHCYRLATVEDLP